MRLLDRCLFCFFLLFFFKPRMPLSRTIFHGEPGGGGAVAAAGGGRVWLQPCVQPATPFCDRWAGQRAKDKGRHSSRATSALPHVFIIAFATPRYLSPATCLGVLLDSYLQHASLGLQHASQGFYFLPLQYREKLFFLSFFNLVHCLFFSIWISVMRCVRKGPKL